VGGEGEVVFQTGADGGQGGLLFGLVLVRFVLAKMSGEFSA
jgi:hypothetical protein